MSTRTLPVLLLVPLVACEGGSGVDEDVLDRLAARLVEVQNDDGSYDWQADPDDALTPTETGYQNVSGVTALGFYGALNHGVDTDWLIAIDATAGYFDDRLNNLIADPSSSDNSIASANWTFLAATLDHWPDATLQDEGATGLDALLDARDASYGDDAATRIDGLMNSIVSGRASIPGIIPWDAALWTEGLASWAELDSSFQTDADDAAAWLADYTENTFLPAYDADTTLAYADISLANPLYVLYARADADPALMDALSTRLGALVDTTGMVTNGYDDDGPQQASAYALLAFKRTGDAHVEIVQTYLEGQVDINGVVIDPDTGLETYEISGEMLRALGEDG